MVCAARSLLSYHQISPSHLIGQFYIEFGKFDRDTSLMYLVSN